MAAAVRLPGAMTTGSRAEMPRPVDQDDAAMGDAAFGASQRSLRSGSKRSLPRSGSSQASMSSRQPSELSPAESEEATPDAPYRDPVACREMVGSDSVLRLTGEMATEYAARQAARRDEAAARGRLRQEHGPADSTSIV